MPCSDSSSSITLKLDNDEKLISFDFAKITCGREISKNTEYDQYCVGKTLDEILNTTFSQSAKDLGLYEEEEQFVLYLEWDALRSVIIQYLGTDSEEVDQDRCRITSIHQTDDGVEIALVILPPKEIPKILPCSLGDERHKVYDKFVKDN